MAYPDDPAITAITDFEQADYVIIVFDNSVNKDNHKVDMASFYLKGRSFTGQAHSGSYQATWSSGVTFNANNGTVQEVVATNSGTIALSNALPGTYLFRVEIDSALSPTLTIDSSLGTKLANSSLDIDNADNAVNIITVVVWPSGAKEYTISN